MRWLLIAMMAGCAAPDGYEDCAPIPDPQLEFDALMLLPAHPDMIGDLGEWNGWIKKRKHGYPRK